MSLIRNRQPRGTSEGGRFAPDRHDEPAVHLGAPAASRFSRFEDRPARRRRGAVAARAAVAAFVLAGSMSLTGCGAGGSDCPSAAVYDAPASTVAYISPAATAAFVSTQIDVPAKGGGGGGGGHSAGGHSSGGHSSSGHESSSGGHESSTGGHTSSGSSGSGGWAPHIWPFNSHSNTCPSPGAKPA